MKIVKKVISENMSFMNDDLDQRNEEERLRIEDEEKMRLQKLAEQEQEKL